MTIKRIIHMVQGLIPENMITLVIGIPNSFKSWLLAVLAIAAAKGDKLFDAFQCERFDQIIYIDADSPQYLYELRLEALGLGEIPSTISQRCSTGFTVHDDKQLGALLQEINTMVNQGQKVLVLLDSLTKITAGWNIDRTDYATRAMERIAQIRDAGATVVVAHHSSIHKQGRIPMNNTQILAGVDSVLYVEKIYLPDHDVFQLTPEPKRAPLTTAFSVELESDPDLEWAFMTKMDEMPVIPTDDEKNIFSLFPDDATEWTVRDISDGTGRDLPDSIIRKVLLVLVNQKCLMRFTNPRDQAHALHYQQHPDFANLDSEYKKLL
jgi:hypothetical protein